MRAQLRSGLLAILGLSLLGLSFYAYLRPAFVFDLANRLWLCL